jgi:hypothetical protein
VDRETKSSVGRQLALRLALALLLANAGLAASGATAAAVATAVRHPTGAVVAAPATRPPTNLPPRGGERTISGPGNAGDRFP